jgi:TonB-linked SusC/RagA family outer membrane protein
MRKLTFLLTCLFFAGVGVIHAQSMSVSGKVVSSDGDEPILGAAVLVKGTTVATFTDANGHFALKTASNGILVVSFLGMQTKEVAVASAQKIVLSPDSKFLEEIVFTGYGITTKKAFTGAATTVQGQVLSDKFEANPLDALKGNVAGLQISTGSGQPGAPSTVFIRGCNSLNSGTQPLYIVDGVPIESSTVGIRQDEGQSLTPLSTLSAEDIESVTVLKDATSTSIYGARAANGVVVITTKRGKSGLSINFTAKIGQEMMPDFSDEYSLVNKAKYYELSEEALLNAHNYGADLGMVSYFDSFNESYDLGYSYDKEGARSFLGWYTNLDVSDANTADVDWLDEVTRKGLIQNYSIDVQSGGDKESAPKYYLSLNYMNDEAIVIGKDMERYSMRYNFDHAPFKTVKYGFNTNLSYTITNMSAGGGYYTDPITQAYIMTPNTSVKNADGSWNFNTINSYNPVAQRSEEGDKNTAKQYRALFSPYLQINLTKSLCLLSRESVDAYILDEFGYWSFLQPQGADIRGMGENSYTVNLLITTTNTLNYVKNFGENALNVLLGQEYQKSHSKYSYLAGSNYAVDYLNEVALISVPSSVSTSQEELLLSSFFSKAEYDYQSKYYVSGSFRFDGSSRFGKKNRWAPFYSVGLKYRLTSEKYMKSTSAWLNDLTLRASYGTTGNQQVGTGYYASRDLYSFGYNYNGLPGSGHSQFGNPDLKWEQTAKFNIGLDAQLFDRLSFTVDFYDHQTKDMVFEVPVSRGTGLDYYDKNIGQLSNRGVELSIQAKMIKTNDFEWSVAVNGSRNVNEIVKLSTGDPIESSYTIIEKGRDVYTFKMKEWAGVDPETGVGTWYKNETGDEITTDYNAASKRYLGTASPDFQGGFTTNLKYKNFDLSFQMNYSIGGKIYGSNLRYDEQTGNSFGNNYTNYVYDNRWKEPGDVAEVPMMCFAYGNDWNSHSSRFLMDASYLKLRSVIFGYSVPQRLIKKIGAKNMRLFVSADNLYTFVSDNYRGFDPASVDADGIQSWNYPVPRNYMFGVNIGF